MSSRGRGRGSGGPPRGGRGGGRGGRGGFSDRGGRGGFSDRGGRGGFSDRGGRGSGARGARGGRGVRGVRGVRGGRGGRGGGAEVIKPEYNFVADFDNTVHDSNSLPSIKKLPPLVSEKGALDIQLRDAYGNAGTKTNVGTNYVNYSIKDLKFWQYHVTFPTEIDAKKKVKQDLLDILFTKEPFSSIKSFLSHNGSDAIFATKPINLDNSTEAKVRFEFSRDEYLGIVPNSILKGGPPPKSGSRDQKPQTAAQAQYDVYCTVEFIHTLDMKELQRYVSLKDENKVDPSPYIVALNVSLGYQIAQAKNVFTTGKNKFFFVDHPEKCQSFQKGLYITSGYFASIVPTFDNVLVSIRPVASAFIKSHNKDGSPMNIAQLVEDYFGEPLSSIAPDTILGEKSFFKNIRITRSYLTKAKPKAIFDLSREFDSDNYKFEVDGAITSVAKYFEQRYHIKIRYPHLPLVHLGGSNYVPMEACTIVAGQEFTGEITDVRGVLAFTTHRPNVIAGLTQKEGVVKIVGATNEKRISKKLAVVPSRIINAPEIHYKNKTIKYVDGPANGRSEKKKGSWDLTNVQFYRAVKGVINLLVVVVAPRGRGLRAHERDACEDAVEEYVAECARHGIKLKVSAMEDFEFSYPDRMTGEYATFIKKYKNKVGFVLNIMPHLDKILYAAVKKVLDVQIGIPNQCTLINKFTKQRFGKFDLQMYALMGMKASIKLGGVNHIMDNKSSAVLNQNGLPALILGADVSHPVGPGSADGVSVASVVGSIDGYFNTFPGSVRLQKGREEVIADMAQMVFERVSAYHRSVSKFPQHVIFYRDGVSYGQFEIILKEEVPRVKEALKQVARKYNIKDYNPKLTFLVIVKRHSTRFFPLQKNAKNAAGKDVAVQAQENVLPGSIIDKGITSVKFYDFFLQSQQALQGTAIPGHYFVLYDEYKFKPDDIQSLTYNLCNLFSRATKSVRVVPPAYYADLMCERGTCYIYGAQPSRGQTQLEAAQQQFSKGIHPDVQHTMVYI